MFVKTFKMSIVIAAVFFHFTFTIYMLLLLFLFFPSIYPSPPLSLYLIAQICMSRAAAILDLLRWNLLTNLSISLLFITDARRK